MIKIWSAKEVYLRRLLLLLMFAWVAVGLPAAAQSSYSAQELDQLVAPVALYPDPLLSNVLVATTFPDQVKQAAASGKPNSSWDASVQALCSYPEVLSMMAKNTDWSNAIGWACSNQVQDVSDAVQRFRYKAKGAGSLQSNDKVQVIEEGTTIRIEPANPQVIYVPQQVAYTDDSSDDFGTVLAYSAGIATSALLWQSVFNWNDACWYHPPYGWRPPSNYYRPYGWQGTYPRATPYYANAANVNRPVNINNINTGNIRINTGNSYNRNFNNVNNVNRNVNNVNNVNRNVNNVNNVNRNVNNVNNVNRNFNSGVSPQSRPSVSQPAWGQAGGGLNPQGGLNSRPSLPTERPAMADYSRSGDAFRASERGAYSRGSSSFSSGANFSGGMRGGGGRRR